ncbi:hypothetical protein M426DRAFT_325376 [Hypoxylon sp. CI-4A]|nr:hypothetical protein M426DRAFT_325376 [Hypoxylon sp. CI-4A]
MARRRDEVPEEEDQEMEEDLVSLQFDEPLSWRAGKPIATGELLRRLEKLSKELVDMDQETIDKDSLTHVAKELASHNLLNHREAGVKAFAAACLVDILKLCAPEAPFTPKQLKEIFTLFVKTILPALWDPTNAYNTQHKYVLTSLAEVKSILLINDVTNSDELLLHLFSSFFDGISGSSKAASGEQVAKDVEFHMTDILVTLVEESPSLPPNVLDVIMAQFLRAAPPGGHKDKADTNGKQTTLLPKEEPEAYVMAKTVCNSCPEKMARYVGQYFSEVIMDVSGNSGHANGHKDDDDSDEDGATGPSESDFKELRKAHQLLRELWRAAPGVLPNVIPQVDAELSADNVQLRLLATETLGDMISGIGAAGPPPSPELDPSAYPPVKLNDEIPDHPAASILTTPISPLSFAQTHSQAFHNFVGRRNDKSPFIRAAWTTAAGYIVSTSAGSIGLSREDESVFVNGLRDKLNDNDEKVRLAAVKAIETFNFRDVVTKLGATGGANKEGSVLFTLADRCRDKRPSIRVEAMALLAKLWAVGSGELAAGQELVISALSAIPSRILSTFYANDLELNVLLERVMYECLIPLNFPPPPKAKGSKPANGNSQSQSVVDSAYDQDRIRAERILLLVKDLDNNARRAFNALQARQPQFSKVLENLVRQCDAFNGGNPEGNADRIQQNLNKTIQYLAQFLPDAIKVEAELNSFAIWHDRRCYQLIKFAVSAESDFKTMHRAVKELVKRVQGSPKPHMLDTLLPLLYRSAYILLNKSHLSTYMDCSKSDKDGLGAAAQEITTEISQNNPDLFKTHVGQLCKDLVDGAPSADRTNEAVMVETLKACSSYSKKYPNELPVDRKFTQALTSYALHGEPAKAAKYAVNVMMARKDDKSMVSATDLLQRILKDWSYDSAHFLTKLAAVSQLELLAPKVASDANDQIIQLALEEILFKVRTEAKESDPEWAADSELDEECQIKCWALKLVVNRLRGIRGLEEAKELAKPVFKILRKTIKESGELAKDTPKHHKARLRLLAGQLFLKLCTSKQFEEVFSHADFNQLAFLTQDPSAMVRRLFVEKLQKYLVQNKLRPRFYTMIFLTAFEPDVGFKSQIETWIRSRARFFRDAKQNVMESTMSRLISLLAHHPDYSTEVDDLIDHARYLLYYVSNIATEANFGMIYKYAERVKQTRDGINPEQSERLYVLSDLTQSVLKKWQEKRNWTFQAYPSKVGLPVGLYTALPSHDVAQEIASTQYLPEGVDEQLDELLKSLDKKKKRRHVDERAEGQPAQKKTKTTAPRPAAKVKTPKAAKASSKKAAKSSKASSKPKKPARSSSPVTDSVDRRRSGRSKKNSTYIERDSSEDDEDMLEGVAEWDYYDTKGNQVKDDDQDSSDLSEPDEVEAPAEEENQPEPVAGEDSELSDIDEDDEEPPPPPSAPKTNGRKGRATTSPTASRTKTLASRPAAKASTTKKSPVGKAKAKAKPAPKARPASTRATRSRRAAAQDEEEEEEVEDSE